MAILWIPMMQWASSHLPLLPIQSASIDFLSKGSLADENVHSLMFMYVLGKIQKALNWTFLTTVFIQRPSNMILKSSWRLEVHPDGWLSDLKIGKATKVLQEEESFSDLNNQVKSCDMTVQLAMTPQTK